MTIGATKSTRASEFVANNWLSRFVRGGDQNKEVAADELLDVLNQEPGIQPTPEQIIAVLADMVKEKKVIELGGRYYLRSTG